MSVFISDMGEKNTVFYSVDLLLLEQEEEQEAAKLSEEKKKQELLE